MITAEQELLPAGYGRCLLPLTVLTVGWRSNVL